MIRSSQNLVLLGKALRALPPGMRGKARLARRLIGRHAGVHDLVVQSRDGSRFLLPNVVEPIGFHLFIDGIYEPHEINWLLAQLTPGDVFVDVGANIGAFAVMAARQLASSGRVVAIEASPRVGDYLATNVALNNLANVALCRVVADATSQGDRVFYDAPMERFGGGALTPSYGGTATSVPARCVDDLLADFGIDRVRVLKIDVEGFEKRVLRGAEKLLRGPEPPQVLFEFYDWAERTAGQPGDAQRLLREWGFDIWTLDGLLHNEPPLRDCLTGGDGGNLVALRRDAARRPRGDA